MNRRIPALPKGPERSTRETRPVVLDACERAIRQSVERGEWARVRALPAAKARYARYAKMTLRPLHKA